jgi:hypothetical protein
MESTYVGMCCDDCLVIIEGDADQIAAVDAVCLAEHRIMLKANRISTGDPSAHYTTGESLGFSWTPCATCNGLAGERTQVFMLYSKGESNA